MSVATEVRARRPFRTRLGSLVLLTVALVGTTKLEAQIADVREGTNIALALSADGTSLVMDLLGGLWQLPANGGGAVPLVAAGSGVQHPRFARDGRSIVMQRWLDGDFDLWLYDLDDASFEALTTTAYDEREPDFSADGRSVVFAANRTGRLALWALSLDDQSLRQLTDEPGESSYPNVSERGEIVYVNRRQGQNTLRVHDGNPEGTEIYRSARPLAAPSWRPGSRVVVFEEVNAGLSSTLYILLLADQPVVKALTQNEDVFVGRAAWHSPAEFLYAADGRIWRRGIGELVRTPLLLFAAVGFEAVPTPNVETSLDATGPHPASGIVGQSTTADGRRTVFAALGDLWLAGRRRLERLTDDAFVDAFPVFEPNGDALVFVSDRGGTMDLWRLDLGNGVVAQLTGDPGKPFEPLIDPTGHWVAYLETEGLGRFSAASLKRLDLARPYRPETVAQELYDARALRLDAANAMLTLEASRVGPGGHREQLEFPLPASPSASAERAERPIPEHAVPEWTPATSEQPYVVQVGRVFDGVRTEYLRHMDIHVEGQRIAAIVRRGTRPLPDRVIDLTEAAVYPGLIDVHAHQSIASGERLGRMWLLNGVTTVREITDDVAEALERAESWASGRRAGPRLLISPIASAALATELAPSAPVVIAHYPNLAPGLAHVLSDRGRGLDGHGLDAREPLSEIVGSVDGPAWPYLRVSARNVSYEDSIAAVLASQTALSTGLVALVGWGDGRAYYRGRALQSIPELFSPSEQRRWSDAGTTDPALIRPLQETVARIVRGGGTVAVASEAPAVPYGFGLQAELKLLAEAGIPNDQVLRLGSASGAIALGLARQLGTLEPGKLADFVVVPGDPLARIADAADVAAVVKDGVFRDRAELLERPSPSP